MNKSLIAVAVLSAIAAGCSGEFWKGGGAGAAAGVVGAGAGYELQARQQMQSLEEDYKAGRIDQHDYEIRKDQIKKGSLAY